jgi:intracellular sulfur oxidation DsrE/DsrF family protein
MRERLEAASTATRPATISRHRILRSLVLVPALGLFARASSPATAEPSKKPHRVVLHVDQNEPSVMNQALNNANNILEYYRSKNEEVEVEFVAYGPGLHMLRDDTSPVKERIKSLADVSFPSKVTFSACGITKTNMERVEGKPVTLLPQARIVPAGVVQIMELQEQGYAYVKP